jgi:hypothetical protein
LNSRGAIDHNWQQGENEIPHFGKKCPPLNGFCSNNSTYELKTCHFGGNSLKKLYIVHLQKRILAANDISGNTIVELI